MTDPDSGPSRAPQGHDADPFPNLTLRDCLEAAALIISTQLPELIPLSSDELLRETSAPQSSYPVIKDFVLRVGHKLEPLGKDSQEIYRRYWTCLDLLLTFHQETGKYGLDSPMDETQSRLLNLLAEHPAVTALYKAECRNAITAGSYSGILEDVYRFCANSADYTAVSEPPGATATHILLVARSDAKALLELLDPKSLQGTSL